MRAMSTSVDVERWRMRLADLRGRGVYSGTPDRHRCIFIHVPKTAGSSVADALFHAPSRHVPYTEYLRANPRKFRSYFKFAFVRNPWDRLVSTWSFLRSGGMNERDRAWASEHLARYMDFRTFVCDGLCRPEVLSWVHFRPQSDFICAADGVAMVDFVGRFERLQDDFAVVAARLGMDTSLEPSNTSHHEPFERYYSEETAEVVGRVYARDAETFGYRTPRAGGP